VFGAGLAVAILRERPTVPQLAGGALVLLATAGAELELTLPGEPCP
jgi:drug/metabolite transporter (DMT)-like permease